MDADWLFPTAESISQRLKAGKLHHALIFLGKQGAGKSILANLVARRILCRQSVSAEPCGVCQSCNLNHAGSHPDLLVLKTETTYGVDQIREAIEQLNKKSQMGGAKVLLIPDAQLMTVSAANALLKTLEEPTANTYIILTQQTGLKALLPTINSRCEKHTISVVNKQQVQSWLVQQQAEVTQTLFDMYWQSPFLLKQLSEEDNADILEFVESVESNPAVLSHLPNGLLEKSTILLDWMLHTLNARMKQVDGRSLSFDLCFEVQKTVMQARQQLAQQGTNKSLQFSKCLREFQRFLTT
ncbi:MAG: AAA family ATPase [Alteromonadaceae bacterium]|nr:AAA family ATPase [Alteromonadaceae bacterium]